VKIELFKDKDKQWRFRLLARNHKIIAQSEGYKRKASAVKAINLLRTCHLWAVVEK